MWTCDRTNGCPDASTVVGKRFVVTGAKAASFFSACAGSLRSLAIMQWMTRVLFYLPVVTPWWFDNIVAPLIRTLAVDSEVHILVAPLWRNTGIGPDQIAGCSAIPNLLWHIVDDPDHRSLRTSPTDPDGLVAFVRSIAPDYVFCRSADVRGAELVPCQWLECTRTR